MSDETSREATSFSRRRLVLGAGGAASFLALNGLVAGCKTTQGVSGSRVLDASAPPTGSTGAQQNPFAADIETFLERVSPIAKVEAAATGFLGDEPIIGHPVLRDKTLTVTPANPTSTETFDVVVVGGGMSGLATAYRIMIDYNAAKATNTLPNNLKNGLKICILEQASRFGGNAKGESWNNVNYSIGAAYLLKAAAGDLLYDNYYGPLGIDKLWREAGEDGVVLDEGVPEASLHKVMQGFWDGATLPADDTDGRRLFEQAKNDFTEIANLKEGQRDHFGFFFPDVPVGDDEHWAQIETLDDQSFLDLLTARYTYKDTGMLHPHMKTLVEHYCWSSFGGSSTEISAAAGLNFFAGEFVGIAGLPGGNSQMARQLSRALVQLGVSPQNMRTNALVVSVQNANGGVTVDMAPARDASGAPQATRIQAQVAVVCCPKFIASKIMPQMPQSHRDIISQRMKWRSYLVANALYDEELNGNDFNFLDLYLLGNGKTVVGEIPQGGAAPDTDDGRMQKVRDEAARIRATDLLQSQWSQHNPTLTGTLKLSADDLKKTVLTFYRGYPFDNARQTLIPYPAPQDKNTYAARDAELYQNSVREFTDQINRVVPAALGLRSQPAEVRVSRWGHPLVLARQGLFRRQFMQPFQNGVGRIYYCNQDNWSLPAIETCLTEALTVAGKVKSRLGIG